VRGYNGVTATGRKSFRFPSFSIIGTIQNLIITFRTNAPASHGWAAPFIYIGGTRYDGTAVAPGGYTTYAQTYTVNPATGVAWTTSDINAIDAGMSLNAASPSYHADCSWFYITVNITPASPNTPSTPSGDVRPVHGVSHDYSSAATDPNGVQVGLVFVWGDGTANTDTGLGASGATRTASHSFATPGTYGVYVVAYDAYGGWSGGSGSLSVVVNHAPNTPSTPSGVSRGVPGTSYSFSSAATDPDGDNVYLVFDWGDGGSQNNTGWLASGQAGSLSHNWTPGIYLVKVYAVDTLGEGSGWSATLSVQIVSPSGRGQVIGLW
jgi:hypothetical protein